LFESLYADRAFIANSDDNSFPLESLYVALSAYAAPAERITSIQISP